MVLNPNIAFNHGGNSKKNVWNGSSSRRPFKEEGFVSIKLDINGTPSLALQVPPALYISRIQNRAEMCKNILK